MPKLFLEKTHDFTPSGKPKYAVVLIHGIASDSSTFDNALKKLEKTAELRDVRFVTFDLLGFGKSIKSDELNYDYSDQLEALHNSISELKLEKTPLILVGHSLGTFIVTRYAASFKGEVKKLVLISPPVYTEKDFDNPAFEKGIKLFKDTVSLKNHKILEEKAFNNSMEKIVLDRKNYQVLAKLNIPIVIIYGSLDRLIASYNMPKLLKENQRIVAFETEGRHGVTRDKYDKLADVLKETIDA